MYFPLTLLSKIQGITHILQVAAGFQPMFPGVNYHFNINNDQEFKYKVINVLDMPYENIQKYFASAIEFIKTGM